MNRDLLPAPPTPLIGRDELLAQLARDHAAGMLVLSGAAGAGKTRLALQHARRVEGARFVELAGASEPVEVARAVGAAVGLALPDAALLDALARLEPPMMVLDGLDDVSPRLREALERWSARGRWVLTSRARVGMEGHEVEVAGLAMDAAIELFERAVQRVRPGYAVGADRGKVTALLEELDRQPLGIELAAGWMDLAGPGELLASLAEGHAPTFAPTVDRWASASIARLEAEVQRALGVLVVLVPGFTLEAAVATVGGGETALDAIRSLRRRHLLTTDRQDGAARLRLPRAVREAARGIALPEEALREAEVRWAAHFADRGAELVARLRRGRELLPSALELARDEPNLVAVVERAAAGTVPVEHGVGAAQALDELSFEGTPPGHVCELLTDLLEVAGPRPETVGLLARLARARVELQQLDEASALLDRAELLADADPDRRAIVARSRAFAAHRRGAFDEAAERAWAAAEQHTDGHLAGLALLTAAEAERRRGDLARAEVALTRADPLMRSSRKLGTVYGMWGMVLLDRGRAAEARDRLRAAMRLLDDALAPRDAAMARGCLAYALTLTGELAEAADVSVQAATQAHELGVRLLEAYVVGNRGLLDHLAGRLDEAVERYHDAIGFFVAEGVPAHAAAVRLYLGLARWRQGQREVARGHLAQAERDFEATGEQRWSTLTRAARAFVERRSDARATLEALSPHHPDVPRLLASLEGRPADGAPWSIVPRLLDEPGALSPHEGLRVGADGSWLSTGSEVVRLHRRKSLRRILAAFVARRGGAPIELEELFEIGWPRERAAAESARHRVYVALSTLRKLGLEGVLQRWEGGYRLDPARPLEVVEGGPPD